MLYKVKREFFINHEGKKIKKDETFMVDEKNYGAKTFYERRAKDGDIKEVFENKKDTTKKQAVINKVEGK